MPVSVDARDRSAELARQVSRSHAVLTADTWTHKSDSDPVSDVEPV